MKRIRLDREAYEQGSCFSLTLATAARRQIFLEEQTVRIGLRGLREAASRYSALVYAFCFMPDHLHLLAAVPGGTSLVDFVRHFKQLTAHRFRRLTGHHEDTLWQSRFYDHALGREEDLAAVASYIWANPIRAGLFVEPDEYQYSGSLVWGSEVLLGSEDPNLHFRNPWRGSQNVGRGLQTPAKMR